MKNNNKYQKQYFMPQGVTMDWIQKTAVEKPPVWCSVDLRDGNQALIVPMSLDEKLRFFKVLCEVGFKEIEVGFPAASKTEYEFCRALIEQNLIPDDVTIQVLTQAREHIIAKTFEALKGAKRAIVHVYNSTSKAQREQVFKKDKEEIKIIAIFGATLCKKYKDEAEGKITLEYSPESFTGTEPEFAAEVCNAVLDIWQPTEGDEAIINLPVTVAHSMPHVYAAQVEYMDKNLHYRDHVVISLHPHNDRGTGIADTEMGLLAGGDRVEGTLFGNGERTGNVDIITLALNMYSQGIDPLLDFSDLPSLTKVYEEVTRMRVPERQPYSGSLVFAAFSGSHQDAIAKGMKYRDERGVGTWTVPYLPLDPADVGRVYEADVIRINSQSGKGGIGYILETQFKLSLPPKFREVFGYHVKSISDHAHRELSAGEVHDIFVRDFVNAQAPLALVRATFEAEHEFDGVEYEEDVWAKLTLNYGGESKTISDHGNGRLDAACNVIRNCLGENFVLESYPEHALVENSTSKAASYVCISKGGKQFWGAGIHSDIMTSSLNALVSAVNQMLKVK